MRNAAPPYCAASCGNCQKLLKPIAAPPAASTNMPGEDQRSCTVFLPLRKGSRRAGCLWVGIIVSSPPEQGWVSLARGENVAYSTQGVHRQTDSHASSRCRFLINEALLRFAPFVLS